CTPAMMLVSKALLDRNPDPSEDDIRWELSGNLCRCTGYVNIVKAIQQAAGELRAAEAAPSASGAPAAAS
ncbi:MAG: (2Fe-2S)-binding protein, partial [Burkholderiales bacterium]